MKLKPGAERCHLNLSYKDAFSSKEVSAVNSMKFFVPTTEPLGNSYLYPVFEFETRNTIIGVMTCKADDRQKQYEQLEARFLSPYTIGMQAKQLGFKLKENKYLAALCKHCPRRSHNPQCKESISVELFLSFALSREYLLGEKPRGKRKDANPDKQTKHITVHDVRFLGHPTVVDLEYIYSRNKTQTEKLRNLPGISLRSGSNQRRYTMRLVAAVNVGISHSLSAEYISEATAVRFNTVKSWKKEAYHSASNVIRDTAPKTCLMLADFSSTSVLQNFSFAGNMARYSKKYTFVIRTERDSSCGDTQFASPRLTGIYPASDWNLVGRLFRGEAYNYDLCTYYLTNSDVPYDVMNEIYPGIKRFSRLSPKKLFTIAFDYLSDSSNNILCKPGAASPVLGALLLAALHPRWEKCVLDPEHNHWVPPLLGHCYDLLVETVGGYHCRDLPDMLSALEDDTPLVDAPELTQSVRRWRILCEEVAMSEGFALPRCLPEPNTNENIPESAYEPIFLDFPLESGIESMQELIASLLLLNPSTLSTVYTERTGNAPFGRYQLSYDDPEMADQFRCAMLENGEFDYDRIVPGIDTDQLDSLLKQGFLRESRIAFFKK